MARGDYEFSPSVKRADGILGTAACGRAFEDTIGPSSESLFRELSGLGFDFVAKAEMNYVQRIDEAFRLLHAVEIDARVLDSNSITGKTDDPLDEVDVGEQGIGENHDITTLAPFGDADFGCKHLVPWDKCGEHRTRRNAKGVKNGAPDEIGESIGSYPGG